MTKAYHNLPERGQPSQRVTGRRSRFGLLLLALFPCVWLSGCLGAYPAWNPWDLVKKGTLPFSSPNERPTYANGMPSHPEMEKAREFYRQQKYYEAQGVFARIAKDRNTSPREAEEALYFEAECLRMRQYYPEAAQVYTKLVDEFPSGAKKKESLHRMFDIANYWLDETRDYMQARNEQKKGDRTWVMPVAYLHLTDKTKPNLDMQGHAVKLLEKIYLNDIDGNLGETSLFWLGNIHFFQENYREADHFYTQLIDMHKNGKHVEEAIELSIICKQLSTGGSEYDGRRLAEARDLIDRAFNAYPQLAQEKKEFLERQQITINMQQADKDFRIAKFYERTGHPGSAYFYYEIVKRRYPGTKYAEKAAQNMDRLRLRAEAQVEAKPEGTPSFPFFPAAPTAPQTTGVGEPVPMHQSPPGGRGGLSNFLPFFNRSPEQAPQPRVLDAPPENMGNLR